eukprot:m.206744 g.206744  ORF g.206744 m.206744 type:complete len:902 (-) comp13757_c0_seq21:842-3547(-)
MAFVSSAFTLLLLLFNFVGAQQQQCLWSGDCSNDQEFCVGCSLSLGNCFPLPGEGEKCIAEEDDTVKNCVPVGCQDGLQCVNGGCIRKGSCTSNSNCTQTEYCDKCDSCSEGDCVGRCVSLPSLNEQCSDHVEGCLPTECQPGLVCSDGVCVAESIVTDLCEKYSPCANGGTCSFSSNPPYYQCNCFLNWEGPRCETAVEDPCDGYTCDQNGICLPMYGLTPPRMCLCIDGNIQPSCNFTQCDYNTCNNDGQCVTIVSGKNICVCPPGTAGDLCELKANDPCNDNPCNNGGVCHSEIGVNGYTCVCPPQYTGDHCETLINPCYYNPCGSAGTCSIISVGGFYLHSCDCIDGMRGTNCDIEIDECETQPCLNGGTCIDKFNAYKCLCPSTHGGHNCQTLLYECANAPCQNGATCTDLTSTTYQCTCAPGYSGTHCETNINDCDPNPCENNGLCTDLIEGFECRCANGFTGPTCSQPIHFCSTGVCANGICLELMHSYVCECDEGWEGVNCDVQINACSSDPCLNDGQCITTQGSETYVCHCPDGFDGDRCEIHGDGTVVNPLADGICPFGFVKRLDSLCYLYDWKNDVDDGLPQLPVKMAEMAAVTIGDYIYFFGDGLLTTDDNTLTMRYNWRTRTFAPLGSLAPRPHPGDHHAIETHNGLIYLFGGLCCQEFCSGTCGAERKTQIYDPSVDEWILGPQIPWLIQGSIASALIGGKVYLCGGLKWDTASGECGYLNLATMEWSRFDNMPFPVHHAASATDGYKFYIFGGRQGGNWLSKGFSHVQVYDPLLNEWRWSLENSIEPMPTPRTGLGKAVFFFGEFYVMGGEGDLADPGVSNKGVYDLVEIYNPILNQWRRGSRMDIGLHGMFPVVVEDRIEILGGGPMFDRGPGFHHEVFAPIWWE